MIQTRQIGSFTEIYSDQNGGESATYFLTEAKTTVFHNFYTQKFLVPGETANDYIEVTVAKKEQLEAARAVWVRPPQSFIDNWNTACGVWGRYNEETGYFELNGILDITYEEALMIYFRTISFSESNGYRIRSVSGIRTNLPLQLSISENGGTTLQTFYRFCSENPDIEVLNFSDYKGSRISPRMSTDAFQQGVYIVYSCPKLKKILGNFSLYSGCPQMWPINICPELEYVKFSHFGQGRHLHLEMLPKLTAETFRDIHVYGAVESYIHVHADVYAKLTGDTTNAAAAALSEAELAEWMALVPLAGEKNIVFIN